MRRVTKSVGGIAFLVWGFCASCEPDSRSSEWGGTPVPEETDPSSELAGGSPFFGIGKPSAGGTGSGDQPLSCIPTGFFPFFAGGAGGAGGASSTQNGFGCPKAAPAPGSKRDWARVECVYGSLDCERTPDAVIFVCCGAKWQVNSLCS